MRKVPWPKPGEILLEEFLKPMGITQCRLAKEIGVPQRRIGEIVAGTRGITADTGLRLARFFGLSEGFWIGLQADYDRETTRDAMAKTLAGITPWRQPPPARRRPTSRARPATRAAGRG
jgi:addiction module HigA family antidote